MKKKKCDVYDHNIVVTIDGPSASGKSTIAQRVAEEMNFEYLDTGAIYRAIAYFCKKNNWGVEDQEQFLPKLKDIDYKFESVQGKRIHRLDGEIVNNEIRTPEISQLASVLAVLQEVRDVATLIQRKIANAVSVVVEGRDAGTAVFPKAPVKIFLTASIKARAIRRLEELKQKYPGKRDQFSLEDTMQEIEERDDRDRKRKNSPLKQALDSRSIDTTKLTIDEVVRKIVEEIKLRKPRRPGKIWKYLIGEKRAQTTLAYRLTYFGTLIFYKIFFRFKVSGEENFPCDDDCATIIAANHASFLDPPAVGLACPVELHALGVDYLFRVPGLSWLLPRINVHPVSNNVSDAGVLRTVVSLLKEGRHVVIFPEGQRSPDNKLMPFKRGVSVLSVLTKCSITPTYIHGTFKGWKRGNIFPRPFVKVTVVFGKPIYAIDYLKKYKSKREAEAAISEALKNRILEMKEEFIGSNCSSV